MDVALIVGIAVLILFAAVSLVLLEDRRLQRRRAAQRHASLTRLGEVDPLTHR